MNMELKKKESALRRSMRYIRVLQLLGVFSAGLLTACTKYGAPEPDYGVPYDGMRDIRIYGNVKSADSMQNIPGINVRHACPVK